MLGMSSGTPNTLWMLPRIHMAYLKYARSPSRMTRSAMSHARLDFCVEAFAIPTAVNQLTNVSPISRMRNSGPPQA